MHQPVMEGRGFYNAHSKLQARSAEEAEGVLARALAEVVLPGGPLTVADFDAAVADFGRAAGAHSSRVTARRFWSSPMVHTA